ncbi:hypothetical protein C3492_43440 [Streptomyces sp. Ru62]|nr:hypothetical protein C3492_43440 [Streptomyces sp. Ru62]
MAAAGSAAPASTGTSTATAPGPRPLPSVATGRCWRRRRWTWRRTGSRRSPGSTRRISATVPRRPLWSGSRRPAMVSGYPTTLATTP